MTQSGTNSASDAEGSISVVICTYQRLSALKVGLPQALGLADVGEVIVVVDGSTDGTAEWLRSVDAPHLRIVEHPVNRGLPFARNTGVLAAKGDWVLFLDDDILVPADYATRLRDAATTESADIVGAPWLLAADEAQLERRAAEQRASAATSFDFRTGPDVFPMTNVETPYVNSYMLVRRAVFFGVRFDESIGGNSFREETSFALSASALGRKVIVTPSTYVYQFDLFDGGCHDGSRIKYELSMLHNNWRFLRRFGPELVGRGEVRGVVREQFRFAVRRVADVAYAFVASRVRRGGTK